MTQKLLTSILIVTGLGAVAACQQQPSDEPSEAANVVADEHYESPGAPTLVPVDVKYRLLNTPQVGQPLSIELTLVSSVANAGLGFALEPESGLSVKPDSRVQSFAGKAAMTPETTTVVITPSREGRFYLHVNANVIVSGVSKSRVISIPIQVGEGPPELETLGEIKTDAEGNPIVSLPASEPED